MSASLEDRLRSYYRDRTDREDRPHGQGDGDERLHRLTAEADTRSRPPVGGWQAAPVRIAAAAALVLALLGVGLVVASRQEEPNPSTGPDPDGEEEAPVTTIPSTTPTTSSTEPTTDTTESTTSTTAGPPAGTGRTSIVTSAGELGGWDGRAWVRHDAGWEPTPPGDRYQVVRLDGTATEVTSTMRTAYCIGEDEQLLDVGIRGLGPEGSGIGVAGVADPLARPAEPLDPSSEVYRTAAAEVMVGLGVDNPDPDVRQVVRTDLDGDGADEVVVVAQRLSGASEVEAVVGDYSVVFVRRLVGQQVETDVVDSLIGTTEGFYFVGASVTALADLNGDGRMEIVVDGRGYESTTTSVYEMAGDGSFTEVLAKGCGA